MYYILKPVTFFLYEWNYLRLSSQAQVDSVNMKTIENYFMLYIGSMSCV